MEITVNGLHIQYFDSGGDALPVALFLHGWGAPVDVYTPLTDYLAESYRVIAPNLPGFGGSEEPPAAWSVDDYVAFTLDFAAALGLSEAVLLCHSFGGRIAIKLLSAPNPPLSVKKAVFFDAAGIRPKRGITYYCKVYSYKCLKKLAALPPIARCMPGLVERVKKRSGSADYRAASPRMREVMVRCIAEDLTVYLPAIHASTLLIWGETDTATPLADGQLMEQRIPDAGLVKLPGVGHFGFLQRFGQCSRILDSFLK